MQSAGTRSQEKEVEKSESFPVHLLIPVLGEGAGDVEFAQTCMSLQQAVENGSMDAASSLDAMPMPLILDLCPRPGRK